VTEDSFGSTLSLSLCPPKYTKISKYQNTKNIPSDCRPLLPLPPPPTIPVVGLSLSKYQSMKIYEAHCQCSSIVLGIGSVHCFTTKRRLHARTLSLSQLCWRRWGLSYRPSLVHPNEISRFAVALGFSLSGSLKLSRSGIRRINEFQMGSVGWLLVHYLATNVLIGLYPLSLSPSVFDLSSGRCPRAISISNFSSFLIPSNCGPTPSPPFVGAVHARTLSRGFN